MFCHLTSMLLILIAILLNCIVFSLKSNKQQHTFKHEQYTALDKSKYNPSIQLFTQLYEKEVDARLRHAEKVLELWQMVRKTSLPIMYIKGALPWMIKEVWGDDCDDPYLDDEEVLANRVMEMVNEVQQAEWLGLPSPDILRAGDE